MRRWSAAAALLVLAVVIAVRWRTPVSPESVYQRALAHFRDGDFDEALADLRSGKGSLEASTDWRWKARIVEARTLFERNRGREAIALLDADDPAPEVRIVRRVIEAKQLLRQSQFSKASDLLTEARRQADAASRMDLRAEIDLVRGQLLARQRRLADAEQVLQAARQDAAARHDQLHESGALLNLGMLRMIRSRCDQAIPLFEEARSLSASLSADYTTAGAANNLGMCYSQLGDFDQALLYLDEARRLARPSARMADILGQTGTLHLEQGEPAQAIPYYRRALETAEKFGVMPEAARWAGNLTLALIEVRDWDDAGKALEKARQLRPEPASRAFLQLNAAAIARGAGKLEEARALYEEALALAPDRAAVQWQGRAGLAGIWTARGDIEKANQNFEAAIRIVEDNRADLNRDELKITFLSRLIRFYQEYVHARMSQNDPVGALRIADSSRARILAERLAREPEIHTPGDRRGFQEISHASRSIWLSYWLAPRQSFLWVVTPEEVRSFVLPPAGEIAGLVERYQGFIERSMRDPLQAESDAGRRLYDTLIGPVGALIPQGAHVIIVPDGALHQLNFETLPVYGDGPHYWMDDVTVAIAPSFAVFREPNSRRPIARKALLIGDPLSPSPEYPALPHAGSEIAAIRKRFSDGAASVITREAARPGAYAEAKPSAYSVIHIAAHAEADTKRPLNSAVILSPGQHGFKLYARDVIDVPLQADLVTLSACRTSGARTYAGEGLVGFAWAFLQAGSRSVIAGLWDVGDESTSILMDNLYAGIAAGRSPVDALHEAKVALRKTAYAKPYYWGPFQCYIR